MKCPYRKKEMKKGVLSGDGGTKVSRKDGDKKADIWDALSFQCEVTALRYSFFGFTA